MGKRPTEFHQCKQCGCKISETSCKFATVTRIINGDKHVFCCEICAELYEKEK